MSSTRNLELPHEYKDHICMIYSCSPCICFNVIAYNRPHQFFKQLGLEEVSIPDTNIHPEKKLSKYKGKNWKKYGDYGKVNNYGKKRHDYVLLNVRLQDHDENDDTHSESHEQHSQLGNIKKPGSK
ncbi:unnamed protein product [Arabidopsis halleri]